MFSRIVLATALASPFLWAQTEWVGALEATIADDFAHQRSELRWFLRTAEGAIPIELPAVAGSYLPRPGDSVRIGGLRLRDGRVQAVSIQSATTSSAPCT